MSGDTLAWQKRKRDANNRRAEHDGNAPCNLGYSTKWPNPTLRNWKLLFEEGVEQIQYSEALGFDYCLIAEHHFTNYGNSPAPLMQALYIGQRTRRLRIGTAAVILPVWQPCAWRKKSPCWTISLTGRFMCGVGRGYQAYEMAGFGGELGASRQKFHETLMCC